MRSCLLVILLASVSRAKIAGCSQIIDHMPAYACRDEPSFGGGAAGEAFVVTKNEKPYILKVFDLSLKELNERPDNELKFLRLFKGEKYIIQLIEEKKTDEFLFEILGFGSNGNLLQYFQKNRELFKDKAFKLTMFKKILQGVAAMHRKKVIHADLKLENIVVDENGDPMLIDFDLSVPKNTQAESRGTPLYMDPVIIFAGWSHPIYNQFRDVYSLGVILYYLDQGTVPISGTFLADFVENVKKGIYTFSKGTDSEIVAIVESCLKADENKRRSISKLIKMTDRALNNPNSFLLEDTLKVDNKEDLPERLRQPKELDGPEEPEELEELEQAKQLDQNPQGFLDMIPLLMMFVGALVVIGVLSWVAWACLKKRDVSPNETHAPEPRDLEAAIERPLEAEQAV